MILSEYNQRKTEVSKYFDFLKNISYSSPELHFKSSEPMEVVDDVRMQENSKIQIIDDDLIAIFMANGFLILYNLIEATMKDVYLAIFDDIAASNLNFDDLIDEVQLEWVRYELRNNKSANHTICTKLAKKIIDKPDFMLNRKDVKFSGNLNSEEIRNYAKKLKVSPPKHQDHAQLDVIKDFRKDLAHGEKRFIEVGKNYQYSDIVPYQVATFGLLDSLIENVIKYVTDNHYKLKTV